MHMFMYNVSLFLRGLNGCVPNIGGMNRIIDALDKLWSVLLQRGAPAAQVQSLKLIVRELLLDHMADPYDSPSHPAKQYGKKGEQHINMQRLYTSIKAYVGGNFPDYDVILHAMFEVADSDSDSDGEQIQICYYMVCVMDAFMSYVEKTYAPPEQELSGQIEQPAELIQQEQVVQPEPIEQPEQPEQVEQSAGQLEFIGDWA